MKRFLTLIPTFILFLIIGYLVAMVILVLFFPSGPSFLNINYKNTTGHSHTRFQEIKGVENIDILFIGPSTTYMGFDPRIFEEAGYSSFNLGTSSQTPVHSYILLQRYLEQLNPKLVIYNPHPGTFTLNGVEPSTDLLSNDRLDRHSIEMLMAIPNLNVVNTFVFSLIANFIDHSDQLIVTSNNERQTYITRGYALGYGTPEGDIRTRNILDNTRSETWKPEEIHTRYFEKIIKLLKQEEYDYLLVQPPVHPEFYERSYYSLPKVKKYFSRFGTYVDFNGKVEIEPNIHMVDYTVHLNQRGVEKFNHYLLNNKYLDFYLK